MLCICVPVWLESINPCSVFPACLQDMFAHPSLTPELLGLFPTGLRNNTSCPFISLKNAGRELSEFLKCLHFALALVDCGLNSRLPSISYKQQEHITPLPLGPQRCWETKCCSYTWTSRCHDFSSGLSEASKWGSEVWPSGLPHRFSFSWGMLEGTLSHTAYDAASPSLPNSPSSRTLLAITGLLLALLYFPLGLRFISSFFCAALQLLAVVSSPLTH